MSETMPVGLVRLGDSDLVLAKAEEDIRGAEVVDSAGEELGKVESLFVDVDERQVRLLEVSSGGILGLGKEHRLIPVDAVVKVEEDSVTIGRTRAEIAKAPGYDPDLKQAPPPEYFDDLYGMTPFWSPGYRHPGFPYRAD
jgi:sporulation protein YlmC with PRC-barrel domain